MLIALRCSLRKNATQ